MRAARDAHPAELAAEGVTVVVVLLVLVVVSIVRGEHLHRRTPTSTDVTLTRSDDVRIGTFPQS